MIGTLIPLIGKWLLQARCWLRFAIMVFMKTRNDTLPNDIEQLKTLLLNERRLSGEKESLIKEQHTEIKILKEKNYYLLEQFRLARHRQFGKSSEANLAQAHLFNEAEQNADEVAAPEKETIRYTRVKPKREPLPKDLPREVKGA